MTSDLDAVTAVQWMDDQRREARVRGALALYGLSAPTSGASGMRASPREGTERSVVTVSHHSEHHRDVKPSGWEPPSQPPAATPTPHKKAPRVAVIYREHGPTRKDKRS